MKSGLPIEELHLLSFLRHALKGFKEEPLSYSELTEQQWSLIISLAEKHGVLSLLYDVLSKMEDPPTELFDQVNEVSRRIVLQNYRLLYISNDIIQLLENENISATLLKGAGTAYLYPVPELRKSGDVDILLGNIKDKDRASEILKANSYRLEDKQHSNHHLEFISKEGVVIELHTMLAEPFDNQQINNYLEALIPDYQRNKQYKEIMGSTLPIPGDAHHAFYLLIHMLQHFLRAGFGLKLPCDWVVLWNRGMDEKEHQTYTKLVKESGLGGFSDRITATCNAYLGLDNAKISYISSDLLSSEAIENFIKETIEAEEFGQAEKDRMVLVRDTTIIGYAREFHHQMRLNYPKIGKCFLFWPVLWTMTLITFLNNNRKIRKVSVTAILLKAKIRSKNLKAMKLFEIEK